MTNKERPKPNKLICENCIDCAGTMDLTIDLSKGDKKAIREEHEDWIADQELDFDIFIHKEAKDDLDKRS